MRPLLLSLARILALLTAILLGAVALVSQPFVSPEQHPVPNVDTTRLQAHVKALSVDFHPRSFDQPERLQRAADYIAARLRETGGTVSLQTVEVDESRYTNVVARFGPAQGAVVVIGAHYDSFGDAPAGARHPAGFSRHTHTPGADDNASGVAGLLELARLLGQTPPQRPVELVAYTTEEPPHFATEHMGSAWHARQLATSGRAVRLMVALEMIGYFSDAPGSQRYPVKGMEHLYSDRGNFIALAGPMGDFAAMRRAKALLLGASGLPVQSINAPAAIPGMDFSDHRNYWAEGMPALMLTDTAFYRNPHYHEAGDTFDTLDYPRMAQVVQGAYALAMHY